MLLNFKKQSMKRPRKFWALLVRSGLQKKYGLHKNVKLKAYWSMPNLEM